MNKVVKLIFWSIFIGYFAGLLGYWGDQDIIVKTEDSNDIIEQEEDLDVLPEPLIKEDTTTYRQFKKYFRWRNLKGKLFKIKFYYNEQDLVSSRNYRNSLNSYSTTLYRQLHRHDAAMLRSVIEAFEALKINYGLNRYEFLEAVVTFIQSIPYTYILEPGRVCGSTIINSKGNKHSYPDYNCKPNIPPGCCDNVKPWGLYAPIEFLIQETGDCDTRTLLAYSILEKFKYDIAIVNSNKMGHSMLGIYVPFVPGNGHFGRTAVSRKKYYLWELTATGLRLGDNYDFYSNDWLVTYQ